MAPFFCQLRGFYEFTSLSILISMRGWSWFSEPYLASWLCCRVFKKSLWTMWLRNMNGASDPYIRACRSFSISSTVCLCHLVQCIGQNTKQPERYCGVKEPQRFCGGRRGDGVGEEDDEGGVALSFRSAVSCCGSRDYSAQRNNCHSSLGPRTFSFLFFLLSSKLCILTWSQTDFFNAVKTVEVFKKTNSL